MKTLIVSRYTCLLLFVLLVSLTGCCSVPVAPTLSPTGAPASPTSTSSPIVAPSPTPSSELPLDTATPSPIPPTRTPRPTPAPTMTADEEYTFVSEMLQDNRGCQLPCWWGFTPGETPWQTAETFFALQGKEIGKYSDSQKTTYDVGFIIPQHNVWIWQHYTVNDGTIDMIGVGAVPPVGQDGYSAYRDPQFAEDLKPYMLPQILKVYGPPQQVFLETYRSGPDRLPFRLLLFYPDQSFLVLYEGFTGEEGKGGWVEAGEAIRMCPWGAEVALLLWSPEREMTFENLGISSVVNLDRLRSLEEATGMSIEQFYQTFVQPGNRTCLEVPAELW